MISKVGISTPSWKSESLIDSTFFLCFFFFFQRRFLGPPPRHSDGGKEKLFLKNSSHNSHVSLGLGCITLKQPS